MLKKEINFGSNIPYFIFDKKINNEIFKKYFTFDIRNMTVNEINYIMSNMSNCIQLT